MLDDIEAYDDIHGLFVHVGGEQGYFVKAAFHEGLVPADIWLRVVNYTNSNHGISSQIRQIKITERQVLSVILLYLFYFCKNTLIHFRNGITKNFNIFGRV